MLFSPRPKENREDLLDREEELESFSRFLESEGPICLILGLRRTGKSSLLRVGLNVSNFPSIVIDLRVLEEKIRPSYMDFITLLNKEFNSFISKRGIRERLLNAFKSVSGVEVSGMKLYFKWRGDERVHIVDLLEKMNELGEELNTKFIIAFDEAQELIAVRNLRFDTILAYAYDNLHNIKIILTGSKVGLLYRFLRIEKPDAPLFGRAFWKIELSYFNENLSRRFLEEGFRQASLNYSMDEIEETVKVFDGIPGWLSYYGFLRIQGADHRKALENGRREAVRLLKKEFKHFLELRPLSRDRYIEIIKAVGMEARRWGEIKRIVEARLGESIPPKNFTELLNKLVESGFLIKSNEEYLLPDKLLKDAVFNID